MALLPEVINNGELPQAHKINKYLLLSGVPIMLHSKTMDLTDLLKDLKVVILVVGIGTCPKVREVRVKVVRDPLKEDLKEIYTLELRLMPDLEAAARLRQGLVPLKKLRITATEATVHTLR